MSFSIPSNSAYRLLKLVGRNLDTYKQMVEESLSVLHFRISAKKEESRSDMPHHICMKKII